MEYSAFAAALVAAFTSLSFGKDLPEPGFADTAGRMVPDTPELKVAARQIAEGTGIAIQSGKDGFPEVNLIPDGAVVSNHSPSGHVAPAKS